MQMCSRATLGEFYIDYGVCAQLAGWRADYGNELERLKMMVDAFSAAGYDYATTDASWLAFPHGHQEGGASVSMNEGGLIYDEASFEAYPWPKAEDFDYSKLEKIKDYLPDGMKLLVYDPGGLLENVTAVVGYENMCIMLHEEPELAKAIFDRIGETLVKYFEIAAQFDSVGAIIASDDWGFNTQTLISPDSLRSHVFPWARRVVEVGKKYGKPTLLHSCGQLGAVYDDIVDMGFSAKHSYEDVITPVEEAYEKLHDRIAVFGGIDVDFLSRAEEADIRKRCRAMLERTADRGGYALGSGNSIPYYLPMEKYITLLKTALEFDTM